MYIHTHSCQHSNKHACPSNPLKFGSGVQQQQSHISGSTAASNLAPTARRLHICTALWLTIDGSHTVHYPNTHTHTNTHSLIRHHPARVLPTTTTTTPNPTWLNLFQGWGGGERRERWRWDKSVRAGDDEEEEIEEEGEKEEEAGSFYFKKKKSFFFRKDVFMVWSEKKTSQYNHTSAPLWLQQFGYWVILLSYFVRLGAPLQRSAGGAQLRTNTQRLNA